MSSRARALVLATLALLGACGRGAPETPSVTANGFTLAAASIALPADDAALPAGPHRELVEAHCTACHSSAMITGQPPLKPAQWQATVEKMQKAYKAPIPTEAVPGIVEYLTSLPGQAAAAPPRP